MSAKERRDGHNYERKIRREFVDDLRFVDCVTSRYESKATDDKKVDLCYTDPFNIQLKNWKRRPNYEEILGSMPDDWKINVIIHRINKRKGKQFAILYKEDLYKIIKILLNTIGYKELNKLIIHEKH